MAFSMSSGRRTAMSEINVTPLVDVMLVLLIIFMVTAPMMQEGIPLAVPDAEGVPLDKNSQKKEIVVSVSDKGNIFINELPVAETDFVEKIKATKQDPSVGEVYLRADKAVPYGTVVRLMGDLRKAGVKDINVITSAKEAAPSGK